MLKNIWAKLSYIWFVFMLFFVGLFVGFDNIYAETLTEWSNKAVRVQTDHAGTNTWSSWKTISGTSSVTFSSSELSYPVNAIAFRGRFSDGLSRDNSYTFRFNFKPTPDAVSVENFYISNPDGDFENITCTGPERYSSGYYWFECTFEPIRDYTSDEYIYVKINLTSAYLTEIRAGMRGADIRKGISSIVTEQTNIIINQNNQINNSINNMNDNMTDDTVDNPNSSFTEFENMLATNGTITNLLLLPVTFFTSVVTNLNSSCQPMILGELYGTNLSMACINIGQYLGNTLWSLIDLILSGTFVLIIAKKFIKVFNNMSSLKEGDVIGD